MIIAIFINSQFNAQNKLKYLSSFSTLLFLFKPTFVFILILPFLFIFKNLKKINFVKKHFYLPVTFLILWGIKNILVSGCLLYPAKQTCINTLKWTNQINKNSIEYISVSSEAWSKDWPNRTDKQLTFKEYNHQFKWLNTWFDNHFKKIQKTLIPYIIFLTLTIFIISFRSNKKKLDNTVNFKFPELYIILTICLFCWFLKFPIYRYGASYIIILIALFFSYLATKYCELDKNKIIIKIFLFICIFIFFSKQIVRFYKNYNVKNIWPILNSPIHSQKETKRINNFKIYYSAKKECGFGKSPCTNYNVFENLNVKEKNGYYIFYFK